MRTGVEGIDKLLEGGIPEGFFVAVTGEPGIIRKINFGWVRVMFGYVNSFPHRVYKRRP